MLSPASRAIFDDLTDLIERADDGARLPTVRELMRRYGVGQATVQEVFLRLKEDGRIQSQVGRGSYVTKTPAARTGHRPDGAPVAHDGTRTVLILANSSMNERCIKVQNAIVAALKDGMGKVMQLSYHDTEHLLEILRTLPVFDAVILQSHYEVIPVRLLSILQVKARALVVDGHALSGVDVDHMGIDWTEALCRAMDHLTGLGHSRIGLVSLDTLSQPILHVRRFFERLSQWNGAPVEPRSVTLKGLVHPTQPVNGALAEALDSLTGPDGTPEVTALVFVGISDAAGVRAVLREAGRAVPGELSAVILGHTDVASEHMDFFTMVGGTSADGAAALVGIVNARLAEPGLAPQVVYIPCALAMGASTAAPPA